MVYKLSAGACQGSLELTHAGMVAKAAYFKERYIIRDMTLQQFQIATGLAARGFILFFNWVKNHPDRQIEG